MEPVPSTRHYLIESGVVALATFCFRHEELTAPGMDAARSGKFAQATNKKAWVRKKVAQSRYSRFARGIVR
jgi:hypothetical protein